MADAYGIEIERRRREIAAFRGVPDFVFRPTNIRKGRASREVGDFLLWVGNVVAIVSHKSRAPEAAARETADRRRAWLDANIATGYSQINGVGRTLQAAQHVIGLESGDPRLLGQFALRLGSLAEGYTSHEDRPRLAFVAWTCGRPRTRARAIGPSA